MVGIVANTDGRADALASAVDVFLASGVDCILHCGDVGGRHVLDVLARADAAGFVWGDRDRDRTGLLRYAQRLGIDCFGLLGEVEIESADGQPRRLLMVHGDDNRLLKRLIEEQQYDYILCGQGLTAEDRTVGRTRLLNPGALHGAAGKSAMILDPANGEMRLLAL